MGIAWTPEWWNIERSQEWSSFLGTQFWQDYACSVEFGSVKWYNIWFCPKTFGLSFKCRYIGGKPHFQTNPNIPYCVGYVSDFDPLCIISMYVCVYIYIIHMYIYIHTVVKCPLPWYLDVTLVTLTRCWHVASFRCVRASSTCGGKEVEAGHWMPDWCWSHLFPGKHWCCCGRSLWWNRVPSISIYHLVSGVGNTTILLGQLGIAICYRWERFNPLTLVAEPCALACLFGLS